MREEKKSPATEAKQQLSPGRQRRRLLQGGLGAAPLVMTVVSRPVLGQSACQNPSAGSMPTSHPHGQASVCSGGAPIFWSQNQNLWPSGFYPTTSNGQNATPFAPIFSSSPFQDNTLLAALQNDANGVAGHLAAARLNVASGWVPPLNDTLLATIWWEYTNFGFFRPTAGVQWFAPDIVAYLMTTETKSA